MDQGSSVGTAFMGELIIGHNPNIPLKDQKVLDNEFNGHETDKPELKLENGLPESDESVEVQSSGDMALSILKNIIAELGPNKGVNFLFDMTTTLISNIQANIATNGFTEIANPEIIKDSTKFIAGEIEYKLNDILENATYTFTKESDKAAWDIVLAKKKAQQEELEEQRKLNALLNSPVVPMKEGFTPPSADFGDDGMEKVPPEVLKVLRDSRKGK